jgi:hypothetical protein
MILKGFVGASGRQANFNADCERAMNVFIERQQGEGAKAAASLLRTPGVRLFCALNPGPVRGIYKEPVTGRVFAVVGYILWEISSLGVGTNRGSVALNSNPATINGNGAAGAQLYITSGDIGYCYDLGANTLTIVVASGATVGGFLDGFFLNLDAATSTFSISEVNDGAVWDPTQVAQRTAAADPWIAMAVVHREIVLMGTESSEFWYNAGASPFPFAPIQGALVQQGIVGSFAWGILNSVLIWVSRSIDGHAMVHRAESYNAVRLSDHSVEFALDAAADVSDCISFTYQMQGHAFVAFVFAGAEQTWVYDAASGLWHERGYWNSMQFKFEALRYQFHCFAFDKHLVGDRSTGDIYELTDEVATDVDGKGIRWVRRFLGPQNENKWVIGDRLELEMQVGVGLATSTGVDADPSIALRISRDSGHTYGNAQSCSIGASGEYSTRVFFLRLGKARDFAFELSGSNKVPYRMTSAMGSFRPAAA